MTRLNVPGGNLSLDWNGRIITIQNSDGTIVGTIPTSPGGGTFVLNGATPVTVANAAVEITDTIDISLGVVGGTVGVYPHIATITAGVGFTVLGTASDTSTYNYMIKRRA